MLILTLAYEVPTPNRIYGRPKWVVQRERALARSAVSAALLSPGCDPVVYRGEACSLTIVSYRPGRAKAPRMDLWNLISGCKWLVDALKHHGLIVDDHQRWLDPRVYEADGLDNPRTSVRFAYAPEISSGVNPHWMPSDIQGIRL